MKKILLASAGVMVMSAGSVYAACIPTPSCASLGYESSSSCEGGLKCPFGNAWNCTLANKITEIEKIIQEGGVGGGGDTSNCVLGSIFYSDHTCSYGAVLSTKTPIGIVVYVDDQGHGQAMSLNSIGNYDWSSRFVDISTLQNIVYAASASEDLASCENTAKIIEAGDKSTYPAVWAVHEYKTEGTNAGDWCLPAAGVFTSYYNNRQSVNTGMTNAGGTQIGGHDYIWSSSEYNSDNAIMSDFGVNDGVANNGYKDDLHGVRPVLEF